MAKLTLGVIARMKERPAETLEWVSSLGFSTCQLSCWDPGQYSRENVQELRRECSRRGLHIVALWAGYPGPCVWDLQRGPLTIGLVPDKWRAETVKPSERYDRP